MIHHMEKTVPSLKPASPDAYEAFLSHLGQKALASITKHVELCEGDANLGFGQCWKRLASTLGRLAPHATEALGNQVVKFYTADGKYRKQVFALSDARDGVIHVYLPDVVAAAITRKILKAAKPDTESYPVGGDAEAHIDLAIINADTNDVPPFCRPMLGWGRRAVRTTLTTLASEAQVHTVERLCELAAESFTNVVEVRATANPA